MGPDAHERVLEVGSGLDAPELAGLQKKGASEPEVGRRLTGDRAMTAIACEIRGKGLGRIRLESIPDATGPTLEGFVRRSIAPGST